jgi:hypothetical protein
MLSESVREDIKKRDESGLFLMILFGLILPIYEISTLLSVVSTTIDPMFPNLNTITSLLGPALITVGFALIMYVDIPQKSIRFYILIAIIIGLGSIFSMASMYPIIGYVNETNLWLLVYINLVIYFGSVIVVIYGYYRNK